VVVFTDICVFHFSILVSVDPQKCSLVWIYLEKCGGTKSYVAFSALEFHSCFFVLGKHTWH